MNGDKPYKFTTKQQRFIDAYNGNATEAALKAGYSKKTARFIGCDNLTKPNILAAIQSREQEQTATHIATREDRQQFWSQMMRTAERDGDKLKASELLGRSNADFIDRHMVSVGGSHADLMNMNERELEDELIKLDSDEI